MKPLKFDLCDTEKTVVQRILEHALEAPADVAVIANDKQTTYRELKDMILSLHKWLCRQGIRAGERVAVQALHEDTCVACFYAVHLAGAILVPLEKSAPQEKIRSIADETGTALIISLKKGDAPAVQWVDYETVRTVAGERVALAAEGIAYPDIDTPCEMIFTTGTTGKSKGVLMTHRNISWYVYSVGKSVEMKEGNRFFIPTPLNHAGGLRRTHLSLANGCCVVYMDGIGNLARYFRYIREYAVTSLYLPPVAIRILLLRTGEKLSEFRDQIDFVYSSSSALPVGDCERLAQLLPGTRLYNAYEASETPGVSVYDYNTDGVLKDCMGKANDGVELAIMDPEGRFILNEGKEGLICVKSRMNMKEYYREPALTATVWKDGWFVSNDLGRLDAQGRVYYRGRRGDVINIGGYKIAPTDVEETALLSGLTSECVCVEELDGNGISHLKLIVVPDENERFEAAELIRFLAEMLMCGKVTQ